MTTSTNERRTTDRRVSPAVGQHAIEECVRLRAENAELAALLRDCRYHAHAAIGGFVGVLHPGVIGLIQAEHGADRSNHALSVLQTASEIMTSMDTRVDAALAKAQRG